MKGCANLTPEAFANLAHCGDGAKGLDIQECPITDAGLAQLAKSASFTMLFLTDCPAITGAGVAEIAKFPELQILTLKRNPQLDDADVAQLSGAPKLRLLCLLACPKLTEEGVDALRQKLPLTEIEFVPTVISL
ncbi:MAG: hypothetical protein HUK22_01900 [Thermoguttaceae bacterium]|nr:hypothetical protein [Thermoguttaceae bacterium]